MKRGQKRRRYVEMEDTAALRSDQIVGLSTANLMGGLMDKPLRLVSKFITTKCGVSYETSSQGVFCQLPLHAELCKPMTVVS